jgi:hypothetical protein
MNICDIQWGDDSAEKDPYLLEYFVTSDSFRRLRNKTKSIVIGRKGSGKSALRRKLEKDFESDPDTLVVSLSPKYNSIRGVLNDKDIVDNYGKEVFFQHTWLRQIYLSCLCIIGDDAKGRYAKDSIAFAREVSVQLNKTSKDFLENISEVLTKLKGKAGSLGEFGIHLERELRNIADVDSLEFHLMQIAESGAKFVIVVDDLDLGWDNSETANNLLLGLLSAANYISGKSHNIYTCVFLREDVYSILLSHTQHSDKYRNVERIRWDKDDLLKILNMRINYNRKINGIEELSNPFSTIFPYTLGTSNTDNWLIERTLSRPRELIQFARYYSEGVSGDVPDPESLKRSESDYSSWKLDDLCAEYSNQYPGLINIFSYWKTKFFRNKYHLKQPDIGEMLLKIATEVELNESWYNEIIDGPDLSLLLNVLYEIGFIGDFVEGGEGGSKVFYSYSERHEPRFDQLQIHPCFRRAVNTVERIKKKGDVDA